MNSIADKLSFYQSAIVEHTPVDFNNPLHVRLLELIVEDQVPSVEATKLMKKAGFQPSESTTNTVAWSSDLFLFSPTAGHYQPYSSSQKEAFRVLVAEVKSNLI
jgi:hypothetical protein